MSTLAGEYRLSWQLSLVDQERSARRQVRRRERDIDRLLDEHATTLRDESGIGPIAAATLLAEVGDPLHFAGESKFARWSGTGAFALSSGEGDATGEASTRLPRQPTNHRVLSMTSIAQHHDLDDASTFIDSNSVRARPAARPDELHKRDTSPTGSSDACEEANHDDITDASTSRLDKGASDLTDPEVRSLVRRAKTEGYGIRGADAIHLAPAVMFGCAPIFTEKG